MDANNPDGRQTGGLNPQCLRLEDMARILAALGPEPITVEMLQADIDDGAAASQLSGVHAFCSEGGHYAVAVDEREGRNGE